MVDYPPAPAPVVALSDAAYAVAASHVGGPRAGMPAPTVGLVDVPAPLVALAWIDERRIGLPARSSAYTTAAIARRWNTAREGTASALLHEHLHILGAGHAAIGSGAEARAVEEGVVSAVAVDALPRLVRLRTGRASLMWRDGGTGAYRACAQRVRVASVVATGAPGWRAKAARAWRVALLHAAPDARRHMLGATGTKAADVCPEAVLL